MQPGIVHIGVGGFHRAHQAMYVDRLLDRGLAPEWGIRGLGLLPHDATMRDALVAQDGLYTLMVKNADGTIDARVIGSILDHHHAPDDPEAAIEMLADPRIRIVSLTVTEGGYFVHPITGELDTAHPMVAADLRSGGPPTSALGYLAAGLRRRRHRGTPPFTVLSCDNIQHNGDVGKRMLVSFATEVDAELGSWIAGNVAFPNSMVDRITPVTTDADREVLAARFGVEDQWPVVCEPFTQWVVEDHFPSGRPPWESVGAQMTADVAPYEAMKLRLLNASHQALCYFGHLAGYRLVHDVCQDPLFSSFLRAYMSKEGGPTLAEVPGVDLAVYQKTLIDRFSNPYVRDTVARLCAESSDRIPKWLLPVVRDNLANGGQVHLSAAVIASWARYAEGSDEVGQPITVVDRLAEERRAAALAYPDDDLAFLRNRDLFGDLADQEAFTTSYRWALQSLHREGARRTLELLMDIA
ncbi:mannitol dehydrogenase family protein [Micromonospora echinospora]|uniref:mannitol dehydrogenase family protein n=1 Tax=Micromonospora echinospora TaxID=1877 RepID=UPI00366EE6AC